MEFNHPMRHCTNHRPFSNSLTTFLFFLGHTYDVSEKGKQDLCTEIRYLLVYVSLDKKTQLR